MIFRGAKRRLNAALPGILKKTPSRAQLGRVRIRAAVDPDTTERDLIARAVAGDDRALEELFLSYYDRLARRIERRLPANLRRTVSEEDILQQTFFAACQELPGFEYRGRWSVYRWLCRIAEFRLRDTAKAQQTAKRGGDRVLPDVWVDSSEQP